MILKYATYIYVCICLQTYSRKNRWKRIQCNDFEMFSLIHCLAFMFFKHLEDPINWQDWNIWRMKMVCLFSDLVLSHYSPNF